MVQTINVQMVESLELQLQGSTVSTVCFCSHSFSLTQTHDFLCAVSFSFPYPMLKYAMKKESRGINQFIFCKSINSNLLLSITLQQSKKKRRDFLKDFLKNAGVGRGSAGPEGKRIEASVLDIRQRMVPQL